MAQIDRVAGCREGLAPASDASVSSLSDGFDKLAPWTARHAGRPRTFAGALAIIVLWGVSGPIFAWPDTWQLIITTGTTSSSGSMKKRATALRKLDRCLPLQRSAVAG